MREGENNPGSAGVLTDATVSLFWFNTPGRCSDEAREIRHKKGKKRHESLGSVDLSPGEALDRMEGETEGVIPVAELTPLAT